jgi:hypothetical protein
MKIASYFVAISCCAFCEVIADSPAIISIDNPDNLSITTNNSELERFQVSVYRDPEKIIDGSLKFALKIDFRNFDKQVRFNDEIIKNSINGRIFYVVIPQNELKNKIFFREIQIKSDNANYKLDIIRLKIEPKVEIYADQKEINFGKIFHNGVRLMSENSPSVIIKYSVLKDAVCEVTSRNNFRLKHENKEEYIPYFMNGLAQNGEIKLTSKKDEYIANFKIENFGKKPTAGFYSDKITFSIKTYL